MPRRGRLAVPTIVALALLASGACKRREPDPTLVTAPSESAVLPKAPPEAAPALSPGAANLRVVNETVTVGGRDRPYVVVRPEPLPPGLPLVFVVHGDGGTASSFHQAWPFERATGAAAVLVYPDGIGRSWDLETKSGNRDVAYFDAIVAKQVQDLHVDRTRIFAAGYSSGGFFSNVYACHRPGVLRALASNAGGAPYLQAETWPNGYAKCPGQKPTAAILLHGTSDFAVDLKSGRFSAAYWAYVNHCNTREQETTGYEECRAYRGCPGSTPVVWCEIDGLGHWVWDRSAEASWAFFTKLSPPTEDLR